MGNSEEGKSCKAEKSSSPAQDQTNNIHVYPDWATIQAYYGPRVAVPPYFNSAVASGHTPHPYMWGPPQPMMPPYGAPYAAIYAHGGVYAHPGVPHAVTPVAATPSVDVPEKSSGNTDQGLMKKLKEFDGLAMSIGNGNPGGAEGGVDHGPSQSGETEGSSSSSDGNTKGMAPNGNKRSYQDAHCSAADSKTQTQGSPVSAEKVLAVSLPSAATGKVMGTVLSPGMTTALELGSTPSANIKGSPASVPQSCSVMPNEGWLQNERELKRERRKQSNRESARRSRLRKQAETEELSRKVDSLASENKTIKSEINQLREDSEKLKIENAKLMDKMKDLGQTGELTLNEINEKRGVTVNTEDLLARVSGSIDRHDEEDGSMYENKKSGAKLRQLLDASPRTDAVAAG